MEASGRLFIQVDETVNISDLGISCYKLNHCL